MSKLEKENIKIPKRRFLGFTDAWEQRKLGEKCKITMGQSPDGNTYSDTPSDFILVQGNADLKDGWVYPRIWTTQKTKTATAGDLIMSVRAPAGTMGKTAYDVVLGRGVAGIKGDEFIFQSLSKMDNDGYWKKRSAGSTFESINSNDIKEAIIKVPLDMMEQQKIGEYFSNLDRLITLHQRKLEKLKNQKKAYLSEMFPAEGENEPKRRFSGFTGAWEQRKLGELGEIMTGSTPSTATSKYYSEYGIPWVTPTDIEGNIISDTSKKLSEEGVKVGRVVPANTILCTCIASIGKNALLTVKGSFNQQINSLTPSQENNPYFLLTESELWSKELKRIAGAGTMQIVNKSEFSELSTMVPRLDEQQKIGEFFSNLDRLITLHQRKLEKLKNLKRAYLKEMFI